MRRSHQLVLSMLVLMGMTTSLRADTPLEPRLQLEPWSADSESLRARGHDPGGPRDLELWAWRDASFSRIAVVRSDRSGRFDFGEIPAPYEPLLLGVAPRGSRPDPDRMVRIERPVPAPQLVVGLEEDARELVVYPARLEGELRFFDASSSRLLMRWPLDATRSGATRIDLTEALGKGSPETIRVQQVLEDGRVSAPAFTRLVRPDPSD